MSADQAHGGALDELRLEKAAHSVTAFRLKEAEKALATCRQTIDDFGKALVDPAMPVLTPKVIDGLAERAEVEYAMANDLDERVEAQSLALLVRWQQIALRRPEVRYLTRCRR